MTTDDGNPCTIDVCDPVGGVTHVAAVGASCSDGNFCNGEETCNASGQCSTGIPPVVDDGDPCTVDQCVAGSGVQHVRLDPPPSALTIDPTIASNRFDTSKYIYTGTCPLQQHLTEVIDPARVSVLRGFVHDIAGAALAGAKITVVDHYAAPSGTEPGGFGDAFTRADGHFEMVVNAGALLTLRYQRDGFLTVQRQILPRAADTTILPDIIMIRLDTKLTPVSLSQSSTAVARGTSTYDIDGVRAATILFPPNTSGTITTADGSVTALPSTVHVRATEYTTAAGGLAAMPADLPATSAFTYAVELNLQEAELQNATAVTFTDNRVCAQDSDCAPSRCANGHCTHPLPVYVENFLHFDTGIVVPSGYYDRQAAKWIASANGRVIKITSTDGGVAQVDTDGVNGADADGGLSIGITPDERARLAGLYLPGQELWRVPIDHFSPHDLNWPYGPPVGAAVPKNPDPQPNGPVSPDCQPGSIIECQTQRLGERIGVTGTPFTLNYRSDRVPGRRPTPLLITVSGPELTDDLKSKMNGIFITIDVADRHLVKVYPPAPNLVATFPDPNELDPLFWDGKTKDGVLLQGMLPVKIRIGFDYKPVIYTSKSSLNNSFAAVGAGSGGSTGLTLVPATRSATSLPMIQGFEEHMGTWDARGTGIGGWTLDVQHTYDPGSQTLYLGNGDIRTPKAATNIIDAFAGPYDAFTIPSARGPIDAKTIFLDAPEGIATGPDGVVYMTDRRAGLVIKVTPDGKAIIVGGHDSNPGADPNPVSDPDYNGSATHAVLGWPSDIALGPDGSLFICDTWTSEFRIRKIKNGIISSFAGCTGSTPNRCPATGNGDGGLATNATLNFPHGVAIASDGVVYVAEELGHRIRRIGTDGIITTLAGTGSTGGPDPENVPATNVPVAYPHAVAVGPDGSVYFGNAHNLIQRVTPDGLVHIAAGSGTAGGVNQKSTGDGLLATDSTVHLGDPSGIAVGADGTLLFTDELNNVLRVVDTSGKISTLA